MTPLETLERRLPEIIKGALKRVPVMFQGYIGADFGDTGRKGGKFIPSRNASKNLRIDTGRLLQSFLPNSKDNILQFTQSGSVFGIQLGTKVEYAAIHETGGTITQVRTPKQRRLFWALYFQTGEERYKFAALSNKPLVTRIPARPYFKPAVEELKSDGIPSLQKLIRQSILDAIK